MRVGASFRPSPLGRRARVHDRAREFTSVKLTPSRRARRTAWNRLAPANDAPRQVGLAQVRPQRDRPGPRPHGRGWRGRAGHRAGSPPGGSPFASASSKNAFWSKACERSASWSVAARNATRSPRASERRASFRNARSNVEAIERRAGQVDALGARASWKRHAVRHRPRSVGVVEIGLVEEALVELGLAEQPAPDRTTPENTTYCPSAREKSASWRSARSK